MVMLIGISTSIKSLLFDSINLVGACVRGWSECGLSRVCSATQLDNDDVYLSGFREC